jgi:hypothetical protein
MKTVFVAVLGLTLMVCASAKDYRVSEVAGEVKCNSFNDGWLLTTTGPCPNFKAPQRVALGSSFSEGGVEHRINVITASQMENDFPEMSLRAGEWFCAAAETEADLDSNGRQKHRTWLYISKCTPVR